MTVRRRMLGALDDCSVCGGHCGGYIRYNKGIKVNIYIPHSYHHMCLL